MSSRIIRSSDRVKQPRISAVDRDSFDRVPKNHIMEIEKQAFEKGYQEGSRIGKQMGEEMVGTVVKRYEQTLVDFAISHKKMVESMERETVRLSIAVAKSILDREISTDPDVVSALVTLAVKKTRGQHKVVLKVSPDDFERVRNAVEPIDSNVRVEQAASLERGDFLLDTSTTHFDGRMASRLHEIGRALLEE